MTTGYITHLDYNNHRLPGYQHAENPQRLNTVWKILNDAHLNERLHTIEPIIASRDVLRAVHTENLIARLERIEHDGRLTFIDQDTYALPISYATARLSAGGVVRAVDAVVKGEVDNALTATRPPGHHATPDRAMGFCLLNNIAIAAQYALNHLGLERILIVDYDVHHGNGTQDIFYDDERVLFISTHQYPFYPATGSLHEVGKGKGKGYTINIPLPSYNGDACFNAVYEQIVWKAARRYQPQLILVSAGFDGHWQDPLGQMRLTSTGYAHLTRELVTMAEELCGGDIVFVMEGGYDVVALGHGMRNIAHALLGEDAISDPYGKAPGQDPVVQPLLDQIVALHNL